MILLRYKEDVRSKACALKEIKSNFSKITEWWTEMIKLEGIYMGSFSWIS